MTNPNNTPQHRRIFRHDYSGDGSDPTPLKNIATPQPWRQFGGPSKEASSLSDGPRTMDERQARRGKEYLATAEEAQMVDVALALRRPLLITGPAGIRKSSLAYAVAWQLGLGNVLRWGVTSRSTLKEALYQYDALARLHDISLAKAEAGRQKQAARPEKTSIGDYLTLGPLGTALLPTNSVSYLPRVLLIDEIDKGDSDLPSDLLHVLEKGCFQTPEIDRLPDRHKQKPISVKAADLGGKRAEVPSNGIIQCMDFPLIIMTSNANRDFPPAFLRRCMPIEMSWRHRMDQQKGIVRHHLGDDPNQDMEKLMVEFVNRQGIPDVVLSSDQLLNAVFLAASGTTANTAEWESVKKVVFRSLTAPLSSSPAK